MKATVIDIGRFIKVPFDVVTAGVSPRAFQVWARIAADASPESPLAQVHQRKLAAELGCSTQTIGRAIAELIQKHLLIPAGTWERGRCKTYQVIWNKNATPMKTQTPTPPNAQMEIPMECYIAVGSRAVAEPEAPKSPKDPNPEIDKEREWIIDRIKADNARRRQKDELEAKKRASFAIRGQIIKEKPMLEDKPICPENYPLLWRFLKIKWHERQNRAAAAA